MSTIEITTKVLDDYEKMMDEDTIRKSVYKKRNKSYYKRFFGAMRIFYNKHFKTNFVIDAVIMIGIHMSYLVSKQSEVYKIEPVSYFYISDVENLNLKTHFKEKTSIAV